MRDLCPECGVERDLREEKRIETHKVRGESITVNVVVPVCPVCGEDVSVPEHDDAILDRVYREFRQRKGLLQPERIAELRKRYGLSQRGLSKLLGLGEITIQRYESGSLQTTAHDGLLRQMSDPKFVLETAERNKAALSDSERDGITKAAARWTHSKRKELLMELGRTVLSEVQGKDPALVGYQEFSVERLAAVVAWLSANTRGRLLKTKLAKLLWLADFSHFCRTRRSMTGLAYARLTYGPVPESYDTLLSLLQELGFARVEHVRLPNGDPGELIVPVGRHTETGLNEAEVKTLARVRDRFGSLTGRELSDLSHKEAMWIGRRNSQRIPYLEAKGSPLIRELAKDTDCEKTSPSGQRG